jgi:hypothetical protein
MKNQLHGMAKVGITTTKTPLSSGFKTKSKKKNINFQQFLTAKNPKSRADDLREASASPPCNFYTYFPILACRLAFAPLLGWLRELPFPQSPPRSPNPGEAKPVFPRTATI